MEKDALIINYPKPAYDTKGKVSLLAGFLIFTSEKDKEVLKIPYKELVNCKWGKWTAHGFSLVHYYYLELLYKQAGKFKKLTFQFTERTIDNAKELYKEINDKMPPEAFKEKIKYDAMPKENGKSSVNSQPFGIYWKIVVVVMAGAAIFFFIWLEIMSR